MENSRSNLDPTCSGMMVLPSIYERWYGGSKSPPRTLFRMDYMPEKLPTIDFLQRRGIILTNMCSLCLQEAESVNHIFIHCPFAKEVWDAILGEVGMAWVFPNNIGNLFQGWNIMKISRRGKRVWSMICPAVCWALWLEGNQRVFENHIEPTHKMYKRAMDFFLSWGCKL